MILTLLITVGLAAPTRVDLASPRALGTLDDLKVEGASGPCERTETRIICSTDRELRFSWTRGDGVLHGDLSLAPGGQGRLFVLASKPPADSDALTEHLQARPDRHDLLALQQILIGSSGSPPAWPDPTRFEAMHEALEHPDPRVRRILVEAWQPFVAGTSFDPLPITAPSPLREDTLEKLLRDPDPAVRRRTLHLVRNARADLDTERLAAMHLRAFEDPHPSVRALALRTLPDAVHRGYMPADKAWELALHHAVAPVPSGRAACNQLARLKPLVAQAGIRPERAMDTCLQHHPERAWAIASAWRDVLPARESWMRVLLFQTVGLSGDVLRRWQELDPETLDALLSEWPDDPHPERRELARALLQPYP